MNQLKTSDKIFVAGHNGLIGSAIVQALNDRGFTNILKKSRAEVDLRDKNAVYQLYQEEKPDVVFLCAAKVGGILANNTYRADFIFDNLNIQNNVIWGAHENNVRRLIFLGSSCVYPREAPQPIPEDCLLTGPLEYTNRPYAIAKIAGLELVDSLRKQYGRDYFSVMPTNLYGPRDNYHPENSHVLPALIRRCCEAVDENKQELQVWGTGRPQREFMYSLDCADAIVFLANTIEATHLRKVSVSNPDISHINVGTGQEVSIRDLVVLISKITGFKGKLSFQENMPDGTPRKLLDCTVLKSLGWVPRYSLEEGVTRAVEWYQAQKFQLAAVPQR